MRLSLIFENLAASTLGFNTLIIGNPPWVTNSELGTISSKNLPKNPILKSIQIRGDNGKRKF
jgi:hypothetical protein